MARLYANENFPQSVVIELRRLGHDILTIHEIGKSNQQLTYYLRAILFYFDSAAGYRSLFCSHQASHVCWAF